MSLTLEQKIEIVGKNYADEYLRKNEKALKKMLKDAYMAGFREGVSKMKDAMPAYAKGEVQ